MSLNEEQQQEQVILDKRNKKNKKKVYRITAANLAPDTKDAYERCFNDFLNHFNITDLDVLNEYGRDVIQQMVIKYIIHLREVEKRAHTSIKLHCSAIYDYFDMHEIILNRRRIRREVPPEEHATGQSGGRAYSHEEINKLLAVCPEKRDRVLILLMSSTGMRIGAIHTIKIGDLEPRTSTKGEKTYKITVYSYAGPRQSYPCFSNRELTVAIDSYLQERAEYGEDITKRTSPLIREQFNRKKHLRIEPKFMKRSGIKDRIQRIIRLSGITKTLAYPGEVQETRGLRKFYKTQAEGSGMRPINVELTHGHSVGVAGRYYSPQDSDILEDFMNHAADALTIDPTQRLQKQIQQQQDKHSAEWLALKQEMHKLKREMIRFRPWGEKNLPRQEFNELLREEYEEKRKAKLNRRLN
jgi:integrase